jgi:hypothetical protein
LSRARSLTDHTRVVPNPAQRTRLPSCESCNVPTPSPPVRRSAGHCLGVPDA